ncbi:VanZ family protein [Xylanimonas cellulosilytica DSM 15894]|uniref:VanZ family protein n=1 Tax=Xylanimonas cellulosilytica (strain DSM 15894 / JCM 12276 / CECT 5975 / KCTC 9989 / LMG 20990 / NBRC 107835 / XIL07) TaxID=446471 RepID=D1BTZ2_XYLCX|nr:VanZ family protein [Xylanimonas cellulosilytica]ACZ29156.1 VanZ family protein [Xylanimonas cellulosilytica DSM 15894]
MRWLRWLFLVYLGAVLSLTLWPSLDQTNVPGWAEATVEFLGGLGIRTSVAALEAGSNLVMFLPFGVFGVLLLAPARRRWSLLTVALVVTAAAFAFSGTIETVQLAIPGRVSTLQDVALNGAGGFLGAVVAADVVARIERRRRAARPSSSG